MSPLLHSTPRLSGIPHSQNTAPVAEFRCLFTHDVRRKQKRWQDGYLKFHSFNSRVMVYDTSRNFLGDTYWKDSNEPQEGDEMTLDKGVMVEVAEAMGITQTDLTTIIAKKSPKETRPAPERPPARPPVPQTNAVRAGSQLRHKSLNTLLGNPKGPIGKSVPIKSPYQLRQEQENEWGGDRGAKRQKMGPIYPTILQSSPRTVAPQPSVITVLSSSDHNFSDITLPPTPPGMRRPRPRPARPLSAKEAPISANTSARPGITSAPVAPAPAATSERPNVSLHTKEVSVSAVTSARTSGPPLLKEGLVPAMTSTSPVTTLLPKEAPAHTTPRVQNRKIKLPRARPIETPDPPPPPSSPPVSVSNRLSNVEFALQPVKSREKEATLEKSPPRDPRAKSLRLSTGVRRGMLFCQSMPPPRARAATEKPRATVAKPKETDGRTTGKKPASDGFYCEPDSWLLDDDESRIDDEARNNGISGTVKSKMPESNTLPDATPTSSSDAFEDLDVIHGLLDQRMIPKELPKRKEPVQSRTTSSPHLLKSREVSTKSASKKQGQLRDVPPNEPSPEPPKKKSNATITPRDSTPRNSARRKAQPPRESTHYTPIVIPDSTPPEGAQPEPPRRDVSAVSSRPPTSPRKPAFSTGGIRKKAKKPPKPAVTKKEPSIPTVDSPSTSAAVPTTSKPELCYATESATTRNGTKSGTKRMVPQDNEVGDNGAGISMPAVDDVNTDETNTAPPGKPTIKTSNKSFKRSRSENDKPPGPPIPSTSDEWERQNLHPTTRAAMPQPASASASDFQSASLTHKSNKSLAQPQQAQQTRNLRTPFQRSRSLNLNTNVARADVETSPEIPSPIVDEDVGPWSTEAFDLFGWAPEGKGQAR